MEATPQPLEGLRGQVDNRVFLLFKKKRNGKSWSRGRIIDHPGGEEWITDAGWLEKQGIRRQPRGVGAG